MIIEGEVTKLNPFGVGGIVEVFFREAQTYVPVENGERIIRDD